MPQRYTWRLMLKPTKLILTVLSESDRVSLLFGMHIVHKETVKQTQCQLFQVVYRDAQCALVEIITVNSHDRRTR